MTLVSDPNIGDLDLFFKVTGHFKVDFLKNTFYHISINNRDIDLLLLI